MEKLLLKENVILDRKVWKSHISFVPAKKTNKPKEKEEDTFYPGNKLCRRQGTSTHCFILKILFFYFHQNKKIWASISDVNQCNRISVKYHN